VHRRPVAIRTGNDAMDSGLALAAIVEATTTSINTTKEYNDKRNDN
jgi:hypothetical protein